MISNNISKKRLQSWNFPVAPPQHWYDTLPKSDAARCTLLVRRVPARWCGMKQGLKLNDVSLRGCRVPRMPKRQKLVETNHLPSSLAFWHHLVAGCFDRIISMWQWYIMRHFTSDIKGCGPHVYTGFWWNPCSTTQLFKKTLTQKYHSLGPARRL